MLDELISLLLQTLPIWVVLLVIAVGYVGVQIVRIQKRLLQISEQQSTYLKDRIEVVDKATSIFERALERQDREITLLENTSQGSASENGRSSVEPEESNAIPDPPTPLLTPPTPPEESRFTRAYNLLRTQQYDEGMRLMRMEAAEDSHDADFAELVAMGQYFGWDAGTARALKDLEQTVAQNPESSGARLWLALAYSESERIEEAVQQARLSLISAISANSRKQVASSSRALAGYLSRIGDHANARQVLVNGIQHLSAGPDRAGVAAHLADLFARGTPPDNESASAFYELALRDSPGDNDLRFRVAYWYGDITMYSNAFGHYRELFRRDPTYGSVLNNLGVAAKHLNMPIKSVEYYREAAAKGESLPRANLASLYLGAGFIEDAQRELDHGRRTENPHRNLLSAMGDIARLQEHEEKILSSLDGTITDWRKFNLSLAAALLDADLSPEISGFYGGVPSNLQIVIRDDGEATGTFFYFGRMAHLTGRVTGRCLRFTWQTVPNEPGSELSLLDRYSGHGLLISENEVLRGYLAPGELKLNEVWSVLRTQWVLSDRIQSFTGQLPVAPPLRLGPIDEDPNMG